jgi:hypothetical protein
VEPGTKNFSGTAKGSPGPVTHECVSSGDRRRCFVRVSFHPQLCSWPGMSRFFCGFAVNAVQSGQVNPVVSRPFTPLTGPGYNRSCFFGTVRCGTVRGSMIGIQYFAKFPFVTSMKSSNNPSKRLPIAMTTRDADNKI